ncbi:hypothetical protein [Gallionella capsiferriformans]|uniref:Uncharacterized protein n=1 Tax=Gallionella capsiferriformans (strain ES-2) TaxID=395494 RepID=D9SHU0_GALCS|nr:hypothetical protein [Gallionella capsiferriformans]ADL56030.1 hypothetical protein Galf_2024 [Gallionella capsiferriformans ES-2]
MQSATSASSATQSITETQRLRNAINTMDCLSQEGFSSITAIAKLIITSLETSAIIDRDTIAHAVHAILGKAQDIENCINYEAESLGCNYRSKSDERLHDAHRAGQKAVTA